jgi:tetratricopeptide (TPR) repeat protein
VLNRSRLMIKFAAIGLFGAALSSTAFAQTAACTGGGKISKQIAKPMSAALDAQRAKKWQDELTKVREAEATAGGKTATDLYYMAEFRGYAYSQLKQYADAARELETALNSPCMAEAGKADRYKTLVGMYTSLRNFPKAIDYGNRALKVSRDPDMQVAVAQAYYQSGDPKNAARVMNELLSSYDQSGKAPKEQQLLLVLSACSKAGDNSCVSKVTEKLVIYYPKPDYWMQLMKSLRSGDTNDLQKLNVMRLQVAVDVMKDPEEYKEMAQLALEEKLSGEAQAVLETGFTKKIFVAERDVSVNTRLLAAAKKEALVEKAALPQSEAAAKAAATGDADVKVGAQYLGFGDLPKAIESLQRGISKGSIAKGLPEEAQKTDEASLLLGMAQLRSNNKPAAAKAFNAVTRDPTMKRIAKLWLLKT